MKCNLVLSVILLGLVGQCLAVGRFTVNIVQHTSSNDPRPELRCMGTVVSTTHILVPASCVTSASPAIYAIQIASGAISGTGDPLYNTIEVERVIIHPDFEGTIDRVNNIAFVVVSFMQKILSHPLNHSSISHP